MIWNEYNIKGSRESVKLKLGKLPKEVQEFLGKQIDQLPGDVTACKVDTYCQESKNPSSMTMTRNIQITIVGISL